jgi:alpha-L-rhamnosidase
VVLENVAGVRNLAGGWERILVRPDARSQVDWASLKTETVCGRVAASWRQNGRVLELEVRIPVGATAEVHVPVEQAADVTAVPGPYAGTPRWLRDLHRGLRPVALHQPLRLLSFGPWRYARLDRLLR